MPTLFNRPWAGLRIIGFLVAAVAALAIAGVPVPGLRETFEPFRIANADVTTACLVVLLAAIVAALPRGQMVRFDAASGGRARWSAIALLGVLPFVFAFGSGNGIYAQASLASGFLLLAAVVCVPRPRSWPQGASLTVSAAITVLAFATAAIISGWQAPFRSSPLTEQTSRTPVGTHGAVLLLDSRRSATITQLQSRAEAVGWKNGTPVIDVSFTWNPAIPYALGGRVPDFLALTIFGYPAAHAVTDFHLSEPYREFPFEEAWLITSRPASISDPTGQAGVDFTIDKLEKVTGRAFPSSYACVMAGDFILWRPATNPQGAGLDCAG